MFPPVLLMAESLMTVDFRYETAHSTRPFQRNDHAASAFSLLRCLAHKRREDTTDNTLQSRAVNDSRVVWYSLQDLPGFQPRKMAKHLPNRVFRDANSVVTRFNTAIIGNHSSWVSLRLIIDHLFWIFVLRSGQV